MTIPDSDWSKDRLMGKSVSFKGIGSDGQAVTPATPHGKDKIDPMLWGRPGHLSDEEADIYVSLLLLLIFVVLMYRRPHRLVRTSFIV